MAVHPRHITNLYILPNDRSDHGNRHPDRLFLRHPPVPGFDTLGAGADKAAAGEE